MAGSGRGGRRQRIVSISFHPTEIDWTDVLVSRLKAVGYRHVSRSEVVNVALAVLRDHLDARTPYEVLRVFLEHAKHD
jgi:hypothetical protein